jgi:hypothetical protein
MIDHLEAIKHELIFLWLIWLVYSLHSSYIKILVDTSVHPELGKVIKSDFKPRSVERSIDLYQRGYTSSSRRYFKFPPPIEIE